MFFSTLSDIAPYTDPAFDKIMNSISGDTYNGDRTMIATLRALLFERMDGKPLSFGFAKKDVPDNDVDANTVFAYLFGKTSAPYNLKIVELNDCSDESFENVITKIGTLHTEQTNIREYIKSKCEYHGAFFVDEEICSCYIIVKEMSIRFFHLIQAFLPRYFPTIFAEKPFTDEEKAFLKTLTGTSSGDYLIQIEALSQRYDYSEKLIAAKLKGFEKNIRRVQIDKLQRDRENHIRTMNEHLENYRRCLDKLDDITVRLEGAKALHDKSSEDQELIDFFTAHKNLELLKVENRNIEFIVRSHLNYVDVEAYECFARNGDIYNNYNASGVFTRKPNRKALMDALFCDDPRIRIKMCAYFNVDVIGDVHTSSGYVFGRKYEDYLPNPHYQRHACLGQNGPAIIEFLRDGNIQGALEQCIAAAQRVNVNEIGPTFRPMLETVFTTSKKIIETEDGISMTPTEALEWLKEHK